MRGEHPTVGLLLLAASWDQNDPFVRHDAEERHGEYRTKCVVLEVRDAIERAIESGRPYRTLLELPLADARVAHAPMTTA